MTIIMPVLAYIGTALLVGYVGKQKTLGFWGYFLISLFFTPLAGLLAIFVEDQIVVRRLRIVSVPAEPIIEPAK